MTRLRKLTLCLTMTVWALLAPMAAGTAVLDESQHPAAWPWPEPIVTLQNLVQDWLAAVFGRSEVPVVQDGEGETSMTQITVRSGDTLARIDGRTELHPEFDPDG